MTDSQTVPRTDQHVALKNKKKQYPPTGLTGVRSMISRRVDKRIVSQPSVFTPGPYRDKESSSMAFSYGFFGVRIDSRRNRINWILLNVSAD